MDPATVLLLAQLTGANTPPSVQADASTYASGNVTAATAVTKAWGLLPGTPAAGTVYTLETEFSGTWGTQALSFAVQAGATWTTFSPGIGGSSFSSGETIAGWARVTVRILSGTQAQVTVTGTAAQASAPVTPGFGNLVFAPASQQLTVAAGGTVALGVLFAASSSAQTVKTSGSTWTTAGT